MVELLSLLVLALAVSLDSFGVGLTYGLRKMRLPIKSLLLIAMCSAFSILIAMGFGTFIQTYMSPSIAEMIGGLILILIGTWAVYQGLKKPANEQEPEHVEVQENQETKVIVAFEIKMLGLVIRILRKPMEADFDKSGTITGREAFLLGIALSLDAFGAGIGAALIGYSPIVMAISVACMSALFVTFGMKSGFRFADSYWVQKVSYVPGLLLILLGLWNIFS
ncbi:sporulation membrane protein YtaF [Alkalihalobacillus sp. LMS39]|uniref:sporulation membrane protein YtaF n=1 Tax=Alkalihalobacillus sp. LMS39 TaxID=2924032 RepID=UPI001FB1CC83|nr:sporulation membrane protein YtaF [Alkalihalobacillus sp. LMS39]UOE93409.1 sporulation membrane protein YtaF [Alkalihalobacillus sp. LMS39]